MKNLKIQNTTKFLLDSPFRRTSMDEQIQIIIISKIKDLESLLEKYKIPRDQGEVYIKKEIEEELAEMHIIRQKLQLSGK